MADDPSISIAPNGPYLVTGLRLVARVPVHTAAGEPIAWEKGPVIDAKERYALCRCGSSDRKPFCDGTHARVGFDGTETATGTYDERAVPMEAPGIVVRDDRSICVHAGFCGTAATNVWKMVGRSEATDVRSQMLAMIERCPSGALTYRFEGSSHDNEPDLATQVAVMPDGPLLVTGGVTVTRADGAGMETRNRVTLCRCGQSENKPLCDGTHKKVGFRHTP
jgi:CDGSH-type Zn-finger protein/ferredoxin